MWLHQMFYQKTNSVGELHMDHICIGNGSHQTQGVSRFIEVGEGISEGEDKELQEIHSPMNNSNELEDQPVGSNVEGEENPTEEKECPISIVTLLHTCLVMFASLSMLNQTIWGGHIVCG